MLELTQIKRLHDKAYIANEQTRIRAASDLVFYYITQWDDQAIETSSLLYRGEFNVLKKAGRQIMSDIDASPVQINFEPKAGTRDDGAEVLDGLYRACDRENSTREAYEVATNEAIVCGFGAWLDCTTYENRRNGDSEQVIEKKPIYEANNCVFFDPNSKSLDKSDARYVSYLHSYSEDGYKDLVEELTGERPEVCAENFSSPEISYAFPWYIQNRVVYVAEFYFREKVKDTILTFADPFGMQQQIFKSDVKKVMDELIDAGYEIVNEKNVDRWQVTKYICSGADILDHEVIAGELLPIIPVYGEHAYVEEQEHWEGITRLAKDPQRLRNFQMSYLADVLSLSPRPKPTLFAEQVAGFEHMYEDNNAYPYYLLNRTTATGEPLPPGPLPPLPQAEVPQSLALGIEQTRQAVSDVAEAGVPQDIADTDLSGKAVIALQNRVDQQSMVYKQHLKHAKRRDAEVFVSMATVIYDQPRTIKMVLPDGTVKTAEMMQQVVDEQTGEIITINDINNQEFEVYGDIGPSYANVKQQTRDELINLIGILQPNDPLRNALLLKYIQMVDGADFEDIRDYAKKQSILQGYTKPTTPEEQQLLQQAAQSKQPDPMMLAAQAEMEKAKAAQMREQRQLQTDQINAQVKMGKNQIDMYGAETDRMSAMIKAQETGAKIQNINADTVVKKIDSGQRVVDSLRARLNPQPMRLVR